MPWGGLRRRSHGPMACRAGDVGTRLFGDDAELAADLPARHAIGPWLRRLKPPQGTSGLLGGLFFRPCNL